MFVVMGLIMTVVVGIFFGLVMTAEMERTWKRNVVCILIALVIGFGLSALFTLECKGDEWTWNNGYCQCNGEWELFDVEHSRHSRDFYYYKCQSCDDVIILHSFFSK